jgi:hypothetical protein
MLLFSLSMLAIGVAAGGFFVTFGHYFATHPTTLWGRRFNRAATMFGLLAAVAFRCGASIQRIDRPIGAHHRR